MIRASQMANASNDYSSARTTLDSGSFNLGASLEVIARFFDAAPALSQRIDRPITETPEFVAAKLVIERLAQPSGPIGG